MPPRLAWFTPLPPVRSGIAAYSAEILPRLAPDAAIDVFVDGPATPEGTPAPGPVAPRPPAGVAGLWSAHAFLHRHRLDPYDLVVYQLGNAPCHDFMWPYLVRYPGLVVLHDLAVHHARARMLLARRRAADYRAEFAFNHPEVDPGVADFAVSGLDGAPYYLWPMTRLVVATARAVAVHSAAVAEELREAYPAARVHRIRMGVGAPPAGLDPMPAPGRPLIGAFGLVTPEKRIPVLLRAFASLARSRPEARLVLVGDRVPHYDAAAEAAALGVADRVTITGFVSDHDHDRWLARVDVCASLRWPTTRETSASWLRALAAGRPTIVTDLAHQTDVPTLDPRSWTVNHTHAGAGGVLAAPTAGDAVAVAIDLLDEEHSLALALSRLAADETLRRTLGRNARAWWEAGHTLAHMAADYREVLASALAAPVPPPPPDLPPHLRADGSERLRSLLAELGVGVDLLD
jgi:glycosyltransferase involved in cell wall biosynthesis